MEKGNEEKKDDKKKAEEHSPPVSINNSNKLVHYDIERREKIFSFFQRRCIDVNDVVKPS